MFDSPLLHDPAVALLNSKPQAFTFSQLKLLLFATTAAKQTIAKALKSSSLCILAMKHRITQAMIHAKTEAVILYKVANYEKTLETLDHPLLTPRPR